MSLRMTTRCRLGLAVVALAGASGCGGSSGGAGPVCTTASGTLSGTVAGKAFSVVDAIVAPSNAWKSGFFPGTSSVLILSDWPNLCAAIQADSEPRDARLVIVDLAEAVQGMATPIASPGTFVLSGNLAQPKVMMAYYALRDPSCAYLDGSASAGSVTLTQASPTAPAGSLALTFDDGGSLSGSFAVARSCDGPSVDAFLNGTPVCN